MCVSDNTFRQLPDWNRLATSKTEFHLLTFLTYTGGSCLQCVSSFVHIFSESGVWLQHKNCIILPFAFPRVPTNDLRRFLIIVFWSLCGLFLDNVVPLIGLEHVLVKNCILSTKKGSSNFRRRRIVSGLAFSFPHLLLLSLFYLPPLIPE